MAHYRPIKVIKAEGWANQTKFLFRLFDIAYM